MMAVNLFDQIKAQNVLLGDTGFEWRLHRSFEKFRDSGALSSCSHSDLGTAIKCILVGFFEPATRLLEKVYEWTNAAIVSDKEPTYYLTYQTLALCEWLQKGHHNTEAYQELVAQLDRSLEHPENARDSVSISMSLPNYVDAGAFERVLEIFAQTPKFVEPEKLNGIRNEAHMCLVIAKHRLGLGYTEEEVATACEKFLKRHMDKWLGDGHPVRAAQWMKIVWSNHRSNDLTPNEIILKCYEYLPHCDPPF